MSPYFIAARLLQEMFHERRTRMSKHQTLAYSPAAAARQTDPWFRMLRKYRPERVRPYQEPWIMALAARRN
jgi:hypothetical protein